ncbi:hypothetical protein C6P45_003244 [Maudiozyma exigua]|uniref:Uncharacterized protein n=1 Tax=Maudiozyma exigua TaxID=34358 RepID=A0A9P6WBY5_MAUEX|nr:hypothetical protein C6P45_003244 [Kazachstania exigua]
MAGAYKIFGKTFQSHQLAIATLLTVGATGFLMTRKSEKSPGSPKVDVVIQKNPSASQTAESNDDINVEKLLTELIEENDEVVN